MSTAFIPDGTTIEKTNTGGFRLTGILPILSADPASPADNTGWLLKSGSSPVSVAMRVRIAGTTYTLAEISI